MNGNKEEIKKKTRKVVIKVDQRSSEELLEEILQRKKEKKRKRDSKNNTIKLNKLEIEEKIVDDGSVEFDLTADIKIDKEEDKQKDNIKLEETKEINKEELHNLNKDIKYVEEVPVEESEIELPKSKVLPPSYISGITETIDITEIVKLTKKSTHKIGILIGIFVVFLCVLFILLIFGIDKEEKGYNTVEINDTSIIAYDKKEEKIDIVIEPSNKQKYCAVSKEMVKNVSKLVFIDLEKNSCRTKIGLEKHYVYFKNEDNAISKPLELNDFLISYNIDDEYFVTPGTSVDLTGKMVSVGDVKVKWYIDDENKIEVIDNLYTSNEENVVKLVGTVNGERVASTTVYTTNLITNMPPEFDEKKARLTCKQFTYEQAMMLDRILENRVSKAGEGTRAGAVAAARFLTLEFPYRIDYAYENGRLNKTGVRFVDGEGRYYHKGLYLDESKYSSLKAVFSGPAMWGCKMGATNGLDCSGFVSWSLLNGGFDVGDYGAGPLHGTTDLTDFGEMRRITPELIRSGVMKVGDLMNIWGHIGILIGIDNDYFYVAESLNTYKGLVVKKYNKMNVMSAFPYVVLMDKVYNGDGNLTNMWY